MTLNLSKPILYLITPGATAETTTPQSPEFLAILLQVSAAVSAGVHLIQIREKLLTARACFELTAAVVSIAHGSATRVLVNDRSDIAASAGADGVHLSNSSLRADVIRTTFGAQFLIGSSTHSSGEAREAQRRGADFAVLGPIFPTPSKAQYGPPLGAQTLATAAHELAPFPLLALGGVSVENARECLAAGAQGIAGISLFAEPSRLADTVPRLMALR